jgi:mannose-6-phosphate isomerase-like protein (cupin superfamily)
MTRSALGAEPKIILHAGVPKRAAQEPATFLSLGQLEWRPILPARGAGSPKLAVVRHEPDTGATAMLIWTPPDFHVPWHWHSGNEKHMLVSGVFIMECDGQLVTMSPGTYNYLPARTIHQAWTPPDSDCLLFTDVDKAWDIHWVDESPV